MGYRIGIIGLGFVLSFLALFILISTFVDAHGSHDFCYGCSPSGFCSGGLDSWCGADEACNGGLPGYPSGNQYCHTLSCPSTTTSCSGKKICTKTWTGGYSNHQCQYTTTSCACTQGSCGAECGQDYVDEAGTGDCRGTFTMPCNTNTCTYQENANGQEQVIYEKDGQSCTQANGVQGVCTSGSCRDPCYGKANGQSCNDGNACTYSDVCTSGVCGGTSYSCNSPPDSCAINPGTCDGSGSCSYPRRAPGTVCNTANNGCQQATCTGAAGATYCPALSNRPDGTSCSNSEGLAGTCQSGACNPLERNLYCPDSDNDGSGAKTGCGEYTAAPAGYVGNNNDCNDNNAAIKPGAADTCNSIDENCDGVDNGCPDGSGTTCIWVPPVCSGSPACSGDATTCTQPPGTCSYTAESCTNPPACEGRSSGDCNNGCTWNSGSAGSCSGSNAFCRFVDDEPGCESLWEDGCHWNDAVPASCSGSNPTCPAPSGGSCSNGCTYNPPVCSGNVACSSVPNSGGSCAYGCTPVAGYWSNWAAEYCDGKDNDCDMIVDEGGVCNDNNNCGRYGQACGAGFVCSGGSCVCGYSPSCSNTYQRICVSSNVWEEQRQATACTGGCSGWTTVNSGTCPAGDACQGAGNCVDVTPPTTAIVISPSDPDGNSGWRISQTTFHFVCSDVGSSGCAVSSYCLSTSNSCTGWQNYSGTPVLVPDGIQNVWYYSTDNQGNAESQKGPVSIKVDTVAPVASNHLVDADAILGDPYTNATYEREYIYITADVNDTTSGVSWVRANLINQDDQEVYANYTLPLVSGSTYKDRVFLPDRLPTGKYDLVIIGYDVAGLGNRSTVLNNYLWIGPDKLIVTLDNNGSSDVYVPFDRYGQVSFYVENMARVKRTLTLKILDPNQDAAPYRYWVAFKGYEKSPQRYEIQQELNPFEEINVPLSLYGGEKDAQFTLTLKTSVDDTNIDAYTNATVRISDRENSSLLSRTPESGVAIAIVALLAIAALLLMR